MDEIREVIEGRRQLTFGSLFAGIGGLELGLERAGMKCVWQVENDGYAQKVLAKHWPDVGRWDDVRTFPPPPVEDWRCDLICGGFPCQDISVAGKKAGIDGARSGLWTEFARIVDVVQPRFVLVENVAALLDRGMGKVLGDLAASGFDAEWDCISAANVGAPHFRDRLFIVAYRHGDELRGSVFAGREIANNRWWAPTQEIKEWDRGFLELESMGIGERNHSYAKTRRILDGVPSRVDRLRCLGNAVVPQVAQWIGRQLIRSLGGGEGDR